MPTITIPTLATHRLTLRGFTAADLDALAPIYADPQVSRYIGDRTPPTARRPGGRWPACWATGSSAAMACGRSSSRQPAG
jgi:RimJ/RimL family protein N-acetyltransferase